MFWGRMREKILDNSFLCVLRNHYISGKVTLTGRIQRKLECALGLSCALIFQWSFKDAGTMSPFYREKENPRPREVVWLARDDGGHQEEGLGFGAWFLQLGSPRMAFLLQGTAFLLHKTGQHALLSSAHLILLGVGCGNEWVGRVTCWRTRGTQKRALGTGGSWAMWPAAAVVVLSCPGPRGLRNTHLFRENSQSIPHPAQNTGQICTSQPNMEACQVDLAKIS